MRRDCLSSTKKARSHSSRKLAIMRPPLCAPMYHLSVHNSTAETFDATEPPGWYMGCCMNPARPVARQGYRPGEIDDDRTRTDGIPRACPRARRGDGYAVAAYAERGVSRV